MAAKDPIDAMRKRFGALGYDGDKMIELMKDPAWRKAFNAGGGPADIRPPEARGPLGGADGGPLDGAAAVRELTSPASIGREPIAAAMTADVEHDGDRGPRAFRDPLTVLDQAADAARAQAVQRLMSAVAALSVDEVAALAWMAWQLPGRKLRRKCEEATATGWCRTEDPRPTARSTPEDRARAALLAAWRQVVALIHGAQSTAARDVAQRDRGDVLADEAARRAGGGE